MTTVEDIDEALRGITAVRHSARIGGLGNAVEAATRQIDQLLDRRLLAKV